MTEDLIYAELEEAGIACERLEHPPVFTVEDSAFIHEALAASHTKNLFLKDKRGKFWLVVLPCDRRADLRAIASALDAGKFSFGKPDEMARVLQVGPGSVTPLAAANAPPDEITVVFDASFSSQPRIAIHPLRNTATIAVDFAGLLGWLDKKGVALKVVPLP